MASAYGIITVANLETYMGVTFDSVDARYTDGLVEAHISQAERIMASLLSKTPLATDPGTVALVYELSKYLITITMATDHPESFKAPERTVIDSILAPILERESYNPVGSVACPNRSESFPNPQRCFQIESGIRWKPSK